MPDDEPLLESAAQAPTTLGNPPLGNPWLGDPPPEPGEPIDKEPPELAAPERFCQLAPAMLDFLAGIAGLPRLASGRPDPAIEQQLLAEARQRLLIPADGPPVLSPGLAALVWSVAAPRLILTAVQRTLGAELRLQVRVGAVPVLVDVLPDTGDLWCTADPRLDVAGYACGLLDLLDRVEPPDAGDWAGRLAADALVTMRTLGAEPDAAAVAALAARTSAPEDLVRAAAAPVTLTQVEVVHRIDPVATTGPRPVPRRVRAGELVWIDGGPYGLWTVEPLGTGGTVQVARRAPADLAAELTALVGEPNGGQQ